MKPEHNEFFTFPDYWGELAKDDDGNTIHGYHAGNIDAGPTLEIVLPASDGAVYGFLVIGEANIEFGGRDIEIGPGTWFTTESGVNMWLASDDARLLLIQKAGYRGMNVVGVLQPDGRLNYINGAKDTQLFGPLRYGEPVCNALYMTPGIHQTMHTHPSTRAGIIVAGKAYCETPAAKHALEPGVIFYLPTNGRHKFRTDETNKPLTLFAWHPDSDFGPKDEDHPMLNRTIVEGVSAKADELAEIRTK